MIITFKTLAYLLVAVLFIGCAANQAETNTSNPKVEEGTTGVQQDDKDPAGKYGKEIDESGVMTYAELKQQVESTDGNVNTKIVGTINQCCQKKGCWMKVDLGGGNEVMVTFKDYGFFVPKNCSGREVVMEGIAFIDTVSVDMLQHYAEDTGKPQEEIDAITEPEIKLAFEAEGVIIK